MCRVNSCCWCCTLKTGVIIIGSLEAIGGILIILKNMLQPYIDSDDENSTETSVTKAPKTDDGFDEKKADVIIEIIVAAVGILFGILLIVGAVKAKTTFLRAWIFYTIASCVIVVIGSIVAVFSEFLVDDIIETILFLVFQICFIIVVNSLYLEIKESGIRVVYKASAPLQSV